MTVRRGLAPHVGTDYRETLPDAADRGLSFVELVMEGPHRRERLRAEAAEVNALASTEGVDLAVVLPLGLDLSAPYDRPRRVAREECEEAIETAAAVGADRAVLRPHVGDHRFAYDDDRLRDRLLEALLDVESYAAHAGLDLRVENDGDLLTVRRGVPDLLERDVGVCLNTAHARRTGLSATDQGALLLERADLVDHLHLVDPAEEGGRTRPGEGTLDLRRLAQPIGSAWTGWVATPGFWGRVDPGAVADLAALSPRSSVVG